MKKFTLLELLIIIAMISMLLSILLPALEKAKQKTVQTVCINNLKQDMLATLMSIEDQNGYFHSPNGTTTGTYYNPLWANWLVKLNYIQETEMFICPSRNEKNFSGGWKAYGARYSSDGTPKFKDSKGGDINTNTFDSDTWMFGDSYTSNYAWHRMTKSINALYAQPWLLHKDRGNMAFFDGHVSSLSNSKYSKLGFSGGWSMSSSPLNF